MVYRNGLEKSGLASDPEAAWGIREKRKKKDGKIEKVVKKWFGYLLTLIVDVDYELPVGFDVSPANESEMTKLPDMFDGIVEKHPKLEIKTAIADAGYDSAENRSHVLYKLNALPIIKMRLEEGPDAECTTSICRCTELGVPICDRLALAYLARKCAQNTAARQTNVRHAGTRPDSATYEARLSARFAHIAMASNP